MSATARVRFGTGPPPPRAGVCLLAAVLAASVAAGCATRRYVGPTTGRSADMQRATSLALEDALRPVSFAKIAGKKCLVEVVSLAESRAGESPENAVARGILAEKLVRDGVVVVSDPSAAEVRLSVRARSLGVDTLRRDFPLLYYRETTTGTCDLHATLYSAPGWTILDQWDARARVHLAQVYWFYIVGPFESLRRD